MNGSRLRSPPFGRTDRPRQLVAAAYQNAWRQIAHLGGNRIPESPHEPHDLGPIEPEVPPLGAATGQMPLHDPVVNGFQIDVQQRGKRPGRELIASGRSRPVRALAVDQPTLPKRPSRCMLADSSLTISRFDGDKSGVKMGIFAADFSLHPVAPFVAYVSNRSAPEFDRLAPQRFAGLVAVQGLPSRQVRIERNAPGAVP